MSKLGKEIIGALKTKKPSVLEQLEKKLNQIMDENVSAARHPTRDDLRDHTVGTFVAGADIAVEKIIALLLTEKKYALALLHGNKRKTK